MPSIKSESHGDCADREIAEMHEKMREINRFIR